MVLATSAQIADNSTAPLGTRIHDEVRWLGQHHYQMLSFEFGVRWNADSLSDCLLAPLHSLRINGATLDRQPSLCYELLEVPGPTSPRFRIMFDDALVTASDQIGPLIDVFYWHANTQAMRRSAGFVLIHSGAVINDCGEAILLPAPSGGGKSTLVAGLVRAGFGYLSDEAGALDPSTGRIVPYPRPIALAPHVVVALFPELEEQVERLSHQYYIRAELLRAAAPAEAGPLRYIVFPRFQAGATTSIAPVTAGQAAMALAGNCVNLGALGPAALSLLARAGTGSSAYRLTYSNLDEAIDAVRDVTAFSPSQLEKPATSFEARSPS